ncbi:golgin subfamily A member 6-like protein 22 isoform X1 [Daphnia carinata]|uniref:golgin subfamily A member 6-like protein 22 isoform X1 n=1 Tax=Daphnia carinata TaxID=120202 RepID=UPI00286976C2|nr:golgin subfamily A member 6-like protein 22 isoform X1 [Daphnia carinata]
MDNNRFISRLHPLAAARKSIHNTVPSEMHRSTNTIRRCATKITSDEQRAKAREHQKRWREKLKTDVAKSAEYREMQRERTRMWKEKMRINEAERFGEISKRHQEQCKKWWDKLTPEQRREKRKQYNLKWRQNQKKGDSDSSDSKETDTWQSYKSYNQALSENDSGPKPATPLPPPDYYSKSNGPVFNVVSGSVVYPFSYFPFRCQIQDSVQRGTAS